MLFYHFSEKSKKLEKGVLSESCRPVPDNNLDIQGFYVLKSFLADYLLWQILLRLIRIL